MTSGVVRKAQRLEQGSNIGWRITVRPDGDGDGDVSIVAGSVPSRRTATLRTQGAICTEDGKKLSNRLELTVSGPGQ